MNEPAAGKSAFANRTHLPKVLSTLAELASEGYQHGVLEPREEESGQRANLRIEPALVSSSLILVDQTLASHVVKHRNHFLVGCLGGSLVATCDGRKHPLNHGAHHRALAGVTLTRFFGLANALACLSSIGHEISSNLSVLNSAAHYPPPYSLRQRSIT